MSGARIFTRGLRAKVARVELDPARALELELELGLEVEVNEKLKSTVMLKLEPHSSRSFHYINEMVFDRQSSELLHRIVGMAWNLVDRAELEAQL